MVSATDKIAASLDLSTFVRAKELQKRVWFTLFALVIYRFGTFIPLPGIDPSIMADIYQKQSGGILGMFNVFAGGALGRMTIFALNVLPYISASIIAQLMVAVVPSLSELKKEGERGRRKINQYTRYGTALLALAQGYGIAVGLESLSAQFGAAVIEPGLQFRLVTMMTLTGGTVFLMWLGDQVTKRGIGNGISLIIFAGIVAELPRALIAMLELGKTGALSSTLIVGIIFLAIGIVMLIVFCEQSFRRLLIQYPRHQSARGAVPQQTSHLPLKLNSAGVIPPIFASALLLMPVTILSLTAQGADPGGWLVQVTTFLGRGQFGYMVLYGSLIAFFCFFYTFIVFDVSDTAENLHQQGGYIAGIRPGEKTAQYLQYVLSRLTVVGAIYLVFVCLLPEVLISKFALPFYFGGTSLLIVVNVAIDTVGQFQNHLLSYQYESLIKKSRLRGRFRKR